MFNVRPPVTVSRKRAFANGGDENAPFAPADPLGRPRDRILLLSGPPGLGKTTLAHVVARHAGYDVLEVNASDDRNAATVEGRIRDAIEAGTGLRSKGKPTCVIVDEVDGAAGGSEHVRRSRGLSRELRQLTLPSRALYVASSNSLRTFLPESVAMRSHLPSYCEDPLSASATISTHRRCGHCVRSPASSASARRSRPLSSTACGMCVDASRSTCPMQEP